MSVLLVACGVDSGHFKLSGRFLNMNQGEFYVYSTDGGTDGIDTIKVVGGRFTYERPCEQPTMLMLVFPNFSEQPIFAEPGKSVEVKADASHMKEMEVHGTKTNDLMTSFRKQTANASPPETMRLAEDFIKAHPESPIGMFLLRKFFIQGMEPDLVKASALAAAMLKSQPKNGALIILDKQLRELKKGSKGASTPRFSAKTIHGGEVSETDLGDDIGILIAWGSWNFESTDMVRQMNRRARSSGGKIRLVSICVDADKAACERIIERDTLSHPIIFDGMLFDSPVLHQMGLAAVPDNVVLRHGKVVARSLSLPDLKDEIDK